MKIAHIIQPGVIAGAERVVLSGCAALHAAGADVTLIVLEETRARSTQAAFLRAADDLPCRVERVLVRGRLGLGVPGALRELLRALDIDVAHAHGAKALALTRAASPRRLACTTHGETSRTPLERGYEALQRALARRADCVFTVTPTPLEGARRCVHVPNPLTRRVVTPDAPRSLPGDGPLELLSIGRLSPEKGLDTLIHALSMLDHGIARLTIVGDGPERTALESLARTLGVDVTLLGFLDDISSPLARSHALALPSFTEGMPLTLIEARVAGLPVIASDVGAVSTLVDHGVDGELVQPGDPASLAAAITRTRLDYDARAAAALARAPAEREGRSAARWAEQTLAEYEDLATQPATFIVFGDDWGAHPSTTQHLMRSMRAEDRIVWVDSIGMRAPKLRRDDLRRVAGKLGALTNGLRTADAGSCETWRPDAIVRPMIAPWHHAARALNSAAIGAQIARAVASLPPSSGPRVLLATNPVAELYADAVPHDRLVYLKLDDYPNLPGVDPALVSPCEDVMFTRADAVLTTARSIAPADRPSTLLPQGVDWDHFASRTHAPEHGERVLGFFGLLAEWLDDDLIIELARTRPDWTLEFVGPSRRDTRALELLPNVRLAPAVPYADLPERTATWSAAWIPFSRGPLTDGVDPLKLREYLAAGLPTACTGLPEVASRAETLGVAIVDDADDASRWLDRVEALETPATRHARRERVLPDGWIERARTLRAVALGPVARRDLQETTS